MTILPIPDIGLIVTGTATEPVEIWHDKRLITISRLPNGHCHLPLQPGAWTVDAIDGDDSIVYDPSLRIRRGDGAYVLEAPGEILVWPYDGDPQHGFLAGAEPMQRAEQTLDLDGLKLPRGIDRLAVQARRGKRSGPIRILRHRPRPKPIAFHIDGDVGGLGPRSRFVFELNEGAFVVEVRRDVRQTGESLTAEFDVTPDENVVSFDDLLHGDVLSLAVEAPHALANHKGHAVRELQFRYHAVPEPGLTPMGDGEPISFQGGLLPLETDDVLDALSALGVKADPQWHDEWPVATKGGEVPDVMAVLQGAKAPGIVARDRSARQWWLQLIEAKQSVDAAKRLSEMKINCGPDRIDAVSRAVRTVDGFPGHILHEIDVQDDTEQRLLAFQERLGIDEQDGDDVVALAEVVQQRLTSGVEQWAQTIQEHHLHWIDGALPPLNGRPTLEDLRQLLLDDPAQGVADLRRARQDIWRHVRNVSEPVETHADLEARKALFGWHLGRVEDTFTELIVITRRAGVKCTPKRPVSLKSLASAITDLSRAVDNAEQRVEPVPIQGPAFVERAANAGRDLSQRLREALKPWCGDAVPIAVRSPARRFFEMLSDDHIARLMVWARFLEQGNELERDLVGLLGIPGEVGQRAKFAAEGFHRARAQNDPYSFAEVANAYAGLEAGILRGHEAWEGVMRRTSPGTRKVLGLNGSIPEWPAVVRRIDLEAAEIRNLGRLLAEHPNAVQRRMQDILVDGGQLDRALQTVGQAGTEDQRAGAVMRYDELRSTIAKWTDHDDLVVGLRTAYVNAVRSAAANMLGSKIGELNAARISALHNFSDIEGARELLLISQYLDLEVDDPASDGAIDDAEAMAQLLELMERRGGDAWQRIGDAILVRLRAAFPELRRYLGAHAPRWHDVEHVDGALRWLYAISRHQADPATKTEPASWLPGTRRLVEHALKERGLWLI